MYPLDVVALYKGAHNAFFFTCSCVHYPTAALVFFVGLVCVCVVSLLPRCCAWFVMTKQGRGVVEAMEGVLYSSELRWSEATDQFLVTPVIEKRLPSMGSFRLLAWR